MTKTGQINLFTEVNGIAVYRPGRFVKPGTVVTDETGAEWVVTACSQHSGKNGQYFAIVERKK